MFYAGNPVLQKLSFFLPLQQENAIQIKISSCPVFVLCLSEGLIDFNVKLVKDEND